MSAPTSNNSGQKEQNPPPLIDPPGGKTSDGKAETLIDDVKKEKANLNESAQKGEDTPAKTNDESQSGIKQIETISEAKVNDLTETKTDLKNEIKENKDKKELEQSSEDTKTEQKQNEETATKVNSNEKERSDINKNEEAKSEVKVNDKIKLTEETKTEVGASKSEEKEGGNFPEVSSLEDVKKDKITENVEVEPKPDENIQSLQVNTDLNTRTNTIEVGITKEPNSATDNIQEQDKACEKKTEKADEVKPAPVETDQLSPSLAEPEPSSIGTREGPEMEDENPPQEECIDIQELSEHVMNIINEGIANENASKDDLHKRNIDLQQFIVKLIHLLKEKTDLSINLERQNSALISQAKSLKDVISITKDLLGIRNMEVEHLQADLDSMQEAIKAERNRHNTAVQHLTEAMGLNDKLKAEYLTQMDLFEKLKEKYTEKVVILTRENIRLTTLMQQNGLDTSVTVNESPEPVQSNPDPNQPESVDK